MALVKDCYYSKQDGGTNRYVIVHPGVPRNVCLFHFSNTHDTLMVWGPKNRHGGTDIATIPTQVTVRLSGQTQASHNSAVRV